MLRAGHPSRVTILRSTIEGKQSGLLMDSVVMTDNLAAVFTNVIYRVIGSLPISSIDRALRHTLNL
jgi:mRNA interferase MazF